MSSLPRVPYVSLGITDTGLRDALLEAARRVLEQGSFILGEWVERFEQAFAERVEAAHAVGVGNGTDALVLALRALNIGPGDEVITAPNSFLASASGIALTGARPCFADVGADYNLDPMRVEEAITERTRAIVAIHLTGRPACMDPLRDLARHHGLALVEDAAQAIGAKYRGHAVGSLGSLAAFSLHPLKNLGACGDAGVITTNDPRHAAWLRQARNHGLRNRDESDFWSPNSRLDALQAALLLVKLQHLETWTEARRANARFYREALADLVTCPDEPAELEPVYHTFVVQALERDALRAWLAERGVETRVHYPLPIHLQPAAADLGYAKGDFPIAEAQAERIVSLPVHPELEPAQLEYVVDAIRSFYRGGRR
jgi:dTDP-4-amino-4,6-dideoxygalactose transaminase